MTIKIDMYRDFVKCTTQYLGGRTIEYGDPFSGEEFRVNFLEPHFENSYETEEIRINFNCMHAPTSFLIGAFGLLAQKYGQIVIKRINVVSDEEPYLHEESLHVMRDGVIGKWIDDQLKPKLEPKYTACRDCKNCVNDGGCYSPKLCSASKRPQKFNAYSGCIVDSDPPFMYIHEVNKGNCKLFEKK